MNTPWSSVTGRLKADPHDGGGGWKWKVDMRSDGRGPQESHARNMPALFITASFTHWVSVWPLQMAGAGATWAGAGRARCIPSSRLMECKSKKRQDADVTSCVVSRPLRERLRAVGCPMTPQWQWRGRALICNRATENKGSLDRCRDPSEQVCFGELPSVCSLCYSPLRWNVIIPHWHAAFKWYGGGKNQRARRGSSTPSEADFILRFAAEYSSLLSNPRVI